MKQQQLIDEWVEFGCTILSIETAVFYSGNKTEKQLFDFLK